FVLSSLLAGRDGATTAGIRERRGGVKYPARAGRGGTDGSCDCSAGRRAGLRQRPERIDRVRHRRTPQRRCSRGAHSTPLGDAVRFANVAAIAANRLGCWRIGVVCPGAGTSTSFSPTAPLRSTCSRRAPGAGAPAGTLARAETLSPRPPSAGPHRADAL